MLEVQTCVATYERFGYRYETLHVQLVLAQIKDLQSSIALQYLTNVSNSGLHMVTLATILEGKFYSKALPVYHSLSSPKSSKRRDAVRRPMHGPCRAALHLVRGHDDH